MKFHIHINQQAIIENKFQLDLIDAAILDFINSWVVEGGIKKKDFEGSTFYWLDYKWMAQQMPLLGIKSKDGVYRRLKKICDQGLLIAHPENQSIGKPHFAFGPKFKLLLFKQASDQGPNAPYQSPNTSRNNPERHTDGKSDNYNINDNIIKDNKNIVSIPLPFESEEFSKAWADWVADRKERKKKLTDRAIKMQFKVLSTVTEDVAIKMIYKAIEYGWVKFYPPTFDMAPGLTLTIDQQEFANIFKDFFLRTTNVSYQWDKNDNVFIADLYEVFKMRAKQRFARENLFLSEGPDLHAAILDAFHHFLNLLNDFHKKRFLKPELLRKNFNTIIAEISHGNSTSKNTVKSAHDYV